MKFGSMPRRECKSISDIALTIPSFVRYSYASRHRERRLTLNDPTQELLRTNEAADFIASTPGTLRNWRSTGKHSIPFVRWGNGNIRYRKSDLIKFIEKHTVDTAQVPDGAIA